MTRRQGYCDLLNYDEDTAGGLMQKEFLVVQLNWPVNKAIMQLRKKEVKMWSG